MEIEQNYTFARRFLSGHLFIKHIFYNLQSSEVEGERGALAFQWIHFLSPFPSNLPNKLNAYKLLVNDCKNQLQARAVDLKNVYHLRAHLGERRMKHNYIISFSYSWSYRWKKATDFLPSQPEIIFSIHIQVALFASFVFPFLNSPCICSFFCQLLREKAIIF